MILRVGQQVGSYRIVAEISHGAYAYIYQASHIILTNRMVALKLLHTTQMNSEADHESFFQEARILEQLKHPHILSVIDANIYEKFPYTVTEFAAGGSLRDRIRRQHTHAFPLDDTMTILEQVAQALHFAHQHKIVHCDLKPENILFHAKNDVCIADFDIARVLQRANAQAVGVGGTPAYMAPEQFQGKVRRESDQYALGCIAYELMTGKRPFKGDDFDSLMQEHLHTDPLSPTQLNPALPHHIEQAILKALSKKPTNRYVDINAFIQACDIAQDALVPSSGVKKQPPQLFLRESGRRTKKNGEIYSEKTVLTAYEATQPIAPQAMDGPMIKEKATRKRKATEPPTNAKQTVAKRTKATTSKASMPTQPAHNEEAKPAPRAKRTTSRRTQTTATGADVLPKSGSSKKTKSTTNKRPAATPD